MSSRTSSPVSFKRLPCWSVNIAHVRSCKALHLHHSAKSSEPADEVTSCFKQRLTAMLFSKYSESLFSNDRRYKCDRDIAQSKKRDVLEC